MKSIRMKLSLLIAVCFFAFFVLFAASMIQTAQTVLASIVSQEKSWLVLQGSILDAFFSDANQYLISLSAEINNMTLDSRTIDDSVAGLLYGKLVKILKEYNFLGSIMDGNFIYLDEHEEFIAVSSARTDYAQRQRVRDCIIQYGKENRHGSRNWIALETGKETLLCKILQVDGGRLGIWVSVDTMLQTLNTSKTEFTDYVAITTDDDMLLNQTFTFYAIKPEQTAESEMAVKLKKSGYTLLEYDFAWSSFKLVGCVNKEKIIHAFIGQLITFALLALLLLCLFGCAVILTKQWFLTPLSTIAAAMEEIRHGNTELRLNLHNTDEEFLSMQLTFNAMMDDITKLKVDAYEARLARNKLRQHYYNLQIKPHFLANAFNMIYQFAQIQDYAMIQKLAMHMNAFYRYTIDSALDEISVEKELFHIKNYLEIQKIRYPENLETHIKVQNGVKNAKLPPLILQVFVENSVRYAINMDSMTVIEVEICSRMQDCKHYLGAIIRDNGPGISAEILEKLNNGERLATDERKHIGIYNSMQRLSMIYHGQAKIEIVNLPERGVEVRMLIPYRSDENDK